MDAGGVAIQNAVELESVHQFVPQHLVGCLIGQGNGHDDAVFKGLGHPTCTHSHATTDGIGLLEIGVVIVKNQRIFDGKSISQQIPVVVVPELGKIGQILAPFCIFEVIINLKIGRAVHVKIEGLITGLVAAKIFLGLQSGGSGKGQQKSHKGPKLTAVSHMVCFSLKRSHVAHWIFEITNY